MKALHTLFLDELAAMYDAELQFVKAMPKLVKATSSSPLKETIRYHLEETKGHVVKLEQVFACFDRKARARTSEATAGLLLECDRLTAKFADSPAINAALISVAQKIEHYEIASYGCLHAWADKLGNHEAAELLSDILDEEKIADVSLTRVALSRSNNEAFDDSDAQLFASVGD